jgi:hypothetical protein
MAKQNQGFRQDLNLQENTNNAVALNNIGGAGIADDIRILQNNLRNISTVSYNNLSNGFFYFGSSNQFVFTNDDIVGVSTTITIDGGNTLNYGVNYYICNSDAKTQFKLSTTSSSVGVNTISITTVSPTNFYFIRKNPVYQTNLINFTKPIIQDTNFSFFAGGKINDTFNIVQSNNDIANFFIGKKYQANKDTSTTTDILRYEGAVVINDPVKLNSDTTGLSNSKSPGIFIGNTRAFSSDNNPWTQVGTALSTLSYSVSVGELYFGNDIYISGISTETATSIPVTSFTHKIPVAINGETYYLLLST